MKKITFLFVLLFLVTITLFASETFTFSGRYALVGANGRTIRRTSVDIAKDGVILATGEEKAYATSTPLSITIGENSLVAIKEDDGLTLYVIYGTAKASLSSNASLTIYTPTTKVTAEGEGDIYTASTDTDELTYNATLSSYTAYDSIRGKYTTVEKNVGYNYIKDIFFGEGLEENKTEVKSEEKEEEKTVEVVVEEPTPAVVEPSRPNSPIFSEINVSINTPSMPIFESVVTSLNKPIKPEFIMLDQSLSTPDKPVILDNAIQTITEDNFAPQIKITQTLVDTKDN